MSANAYDITTGSGSSDPVSIRVVTQLADAQGLDPRDLPPLGPVIDLEALDRLVDSTTTDVTVSFSVDGYDVTVSNDGTITLESSPDS
jgi:hypothetical protein